MVIDACGSTLIYNRHRWTGRYEAHLWDKSTWNQNQNKKGKQGLSACLSFVLHLKAS